MPNDNIARLRRFWWAPLLVLLLLDLVWPMSMREIWPILYRSHPDMLQVVRWAPTVLLIGAEVAWLSLAWPGLRLGGVYQILLGLQAALPLAWTAAWLFGLSQWAAGHSMSFLYHLLRLLVPLVQIAFLATAFSLRRQEPEEASAAVLASAGLVMMDGGWIGIGLGSILAWIWNDPLPADLCGEGAGTATRASIVSLGLFVAAPVLAVLPFFLNHSWGESAIDAMGAVPALFLGSLAWNGMAARMRSRSRAWSVLTWVLFAVGFLLMVALLFVLAVFHAYSSGGPR